MRGRRKWRRIRRWKWGRRKRRPQQRWTFCSLAAAPAADADGRGGSFLGGSGGAGGCVQAVKKKKGEVGRVKNPRATS
jgi:hypothetical protein